MAGNNRVLCYSERVAETAALTELFTRRRFITLASHVASERRVFVLMIKSVYKHRAARRGMVGRCVMTRSHYYSDETESTARSTYRCAYLQHLTCTVQKLRHPHPLRFEYRGVRELPKLCVEIRPDS